MVNDKNKTESYEKIEVSGNLADGSPVMFISRILKKRMILYKRDGPFCSPLVIREYYINFI